MIKVTDSNTLRPLHYQKSYFSAMKEHQLYMDIYTKNWRAMLFRFISLQRVLYDYPAQ